MSKTFRKRVFTLLRIVVCVGLLWWVLSDVTWNDYATLTDGREVRLLGVSDQSIEILDAEGETHTLSRADIAGHDDNAEEIRYGVPSLVKRSQKRYLLFYLLFFAPAPLLMSKRLQWLLRAQAIHITYWESVKVCYAGNFLNFTLIGSTGGDVFKAYYVTLHTERKTEAVTTVLIDRVIGLIGLFIMVAMIVLPLAGRPSLRYVTVFSVLFLAGVVVGCLLLVSPRFRALVARMPGVTRLPLLTHIRRAEAATRRVLQHRWLLLWSVVITVAIHWLCTTSFFFAAITLGMDTGGGKWVEYYSFIAAGNIVAAIPISFMGLGTMEAFLREFLGDYASVSQIVLLAMCVRLVGLFWALPGALVALTGAYRPRSVDALDELTTPESAPLPEGSSALSTPSEHIPEKI